MIIDDVVRKIPNIVASFYEYIYIINKKEDAFYNIEYDGFELKISVKKTYTEFIEKFNDYQGNVIEDINQDDNLKALYETKDNKKKIVTVDVDGDYKLIFVMDITKKLNEDKKILLIADDSPVITKFFTKIFANEYEILVAKDGNEAIKLVEDYMDKPLVGAFFDLQMPNKNGYEVLDYFKEHDLFNKIPVSIISGEDTQDGINKATEYPIVDMLQKPFSVEAAKTIVSKTISFSSKK